MIAMWLGFWLYSVLGGNHDAWWAFPFFVTDFIAVCFEVLVYGFFMSEWLNDKPSENQH